MRFLLKKCVLTNKVWVADTLLIVLILLAGAVLRFWRLYDIPFTYDEFSAIFRTRFATFGELIDKGVKVDTHPAGVQVFLFYLVRIFGISEAAVKTPFIVFGLLSVWLTYLIGKEWFSPAAGLVSASFVSFLQFPVMYSQIARPYSSGLFFCLLLVWFWTQVIFHPGRKYYYNLAGYVISGALCTYNHHFSLLFAAMVAVTGLFWCRRERLVSYLLGGILIGIIYLPHLPIFFAQLAMGGIEGWLHKPRYDFIFDYIQYIFQFSVFVGLLILLLLSLALYWREDAQKVKGKFLLISLLWFLIPYLVGFFYSIFRSSVLQYSVLIFSFPFLLFTIFGWIGDTGALRKAVMVVLTGLVVIPSLTGERQHYTLFYRSPYREMVAESKHMTDSLGRYNCSVILDTKKEITHYYLTKLNCKELPFRDISSFRGKRDFIDFLDKSRTNYLAFGCISSTLSENYPIILERFPFLVEHKSYAGGDFYLFSKIRPAKEMSEYFYSKLNTFEPSLPEWGYVDDKRCTDSLVIEGRKSFDAQTGTDFGPTFTMPLRSFMRDENDVIDISADMRLPLVFPGAWLVVTVTSNGKIVYWNSASVTEYITPGQQGRVYRSLRLSDIDLRHHGLQFATYLWNPVKSSYIMDNFSVRMRSGNPVVYGIYRKAALY
ncbi:MAG: glycosyltransferase family 39 protein [Bacteroidota bacterium]